MRSLYLRVWLTVVAVLALFALGSGWLAQRQIVEERRQFSENARDRIMALAELIGQALPEPEVAPELQAQALQQWSDRLRVPLALDNAQGQRIASTTAFDRRTAEAAEAPSALRWTLEDGRTLWVLRGRRGPAAGGNTPGIPPGPPPGAGWLAISGWPGTPLGGSTWVALSLTLFLAVALGVYPVVRRLTRRLEALQRGMEQFGSGSLGHRVDVEGRDEVAQLAQAFNESARRIEALVQAHGQLVANASHELRSPLARLKMALSLAQDATDPGVRATFQKEISRSLSELDALIEELLLSSRLQADPTRPEPHRTPVDLLGLVAEEAAHVQAEWDHADPLPAWPVEERLIRRAVRNLLENARRYGDGQVTVAVHHRGDTATIDVMDRGAGVPPALRDRIFEPFYRLPGHAESEGGVGLGLALVRQIAQRHGGFIEVTDRAGGGSCFRLSVPRTPADAVP